MESAGRVFRRQSVITRRELGQDIKVIYSFGRNPFFLCIERSEDQRDKGFSNSLQLRLPLSFGGKVGMLFSRLLVLCVCRRVGLFVCFMHELISSPLRTEPLLYFGGPLSITSIL